jgi:nitrite reductase/ring-hydroxylating ferredoxin subunit
VASLTATIADLLGEELYPERPPRPSIDEALRTCPLGEVRPARCGVLDVAVGRLADGRPIVVADRCPHDGGPLSDGFLEADRLVCARHGWEFETASGRCVGHFGRPAQVLSIARGSGKPGNSSDS